MSRRRRTRGRGAGEAESPAEAVRRGHGLWQAGRVAAARAAVAEGVARCGPGLAERCGVAAALGLVDGYAEAARLLREALDSGEGADVAGVAEAWRLLALAHERLNQLEAARSAAGEAVAQAAGLGKAARAEAALIDARLRRRLGEADAAADALAGVLVSGGGLAAGLRTAMHYEHAAALDAAGRFEAAWGAAGAAKALLRPLAGPVRPEAARAVQVFEGLAERLTAEDFARWASHRFEPLPFELAVLVGHPRSGTTLVEKRLAAATGALDLDEQPFLDAALAKAFVGLAPGQTPADALRGATGQRLRAARAAYVRAVAEYAGVSGAGELRGRLVLDKHPEVMRSLPMVARVFPEARVVVVHREPLDVVLSCFMLDVALTAVSVDWLDARGAAVRYARLAVGLERVIGSLAQPVHVTRYEDAVADEAGEVARLVAALGIEPAPNGKVQPAEAGVIRSPTYPRASQPVSGDRLARWRHYPWLVEACAGVLEPVQGD